MPAGFQVFNDSQSIMIDETLPNWGQAPARLNSDLAFDVFAHDGRYQFVPYSELNHVRLNYGLETFDENGNLLYSSARCPLRIIERYRQGPLGLNGSYTKTHSGKLGIAILNQTILQQFVEFTTAAYIQQFQIQYAINSASQITLAETTSQAYWGSPPAPPWDIGDGPFLDVLWVDLTGLSPTTGY